MLASEAISLKFGICSVKSIPDFGFTIKENVGYLIYTIAFFPSLET